MHLHNELAGGLPFNAGIWWFDENGVANPVGPLGKSTEKWFLSQLGQVKFELRPDLIEITWDTSYAFEAAIGAVVQYLDSMAIDVNVHLNFFYRGWCYEKFDSPLWALERIEEVRHFKSIALLHDTCVSNCLISDIRFSNPRLKKGFQSWESTKGQLDKAGNEALASMLPYSLVFKPDKKEENINYAWVGRDSVAARVYGQEWMEEAIGKPTECSFGSESQQFADKVSTGIVETLLSGEPMYQHFRSLMHIEGEEPFWVPYERLLTRHVLRCGSPIVISDVYPTQHIDIPLVSRP